MVDHRTSKLKNLVVRCVSWWPRTTGPPLISNTVYSPAKDAITHGQKLPTNVLPNVKNLKTRPFGVVRVKMGDKITFFLLCTIDFRMKYERGRSKYERSRMISEQRTNISNDFRKMYEPPGIISPFVDSSTLFVRMVRDFWPFG